MIRGIHKTLLAIALVMVTVECLAATTLKIATVAPDGTVWMTKMRAAGKAIESVTEGRVQLKFYPGGVMGAAPTVLRKMRVGQLQGAAFTGGELATVYPDFYLYSVPFLFNDLNEVEHVRGFLDERLMKGLEKHGLVALGIAGADFAYLMSDRPIVDREDLRQAKVWVPEGDEVSGLSLELAGVSPVPLPLSDVYTGLQTGLIDTVVNTPAGSIAFQWHTRLNYLTDVPVSYVIGAVAVDARAYSRISEPDQAALRRIMGATLQELQSASRQDNLEAKSVLAKEGIQPLTLTAEQLEPWRDLAWQTLDKLAASDQLQFDHLDALRTAIRDYRAERTARKATAGDEHQ